MPTGSVFTAIPSIADLKALPAGDLAVGTLYICAVKHPVDDLYRHETYAWHDYANATGDLGELILEHDTESGFFVCTSNRVHYGTGAPSGTFPLNAVNVLNKLGLFTWVDTSTNPHTWYDYTTTNPSIAGTWVERQSVPAGSVTDAKLGNRTVDQAIATASANTGTLTQILSWITKAIRAATGTTNWYDAPATTLATTATHIANTSNPHSVTAGQVGADPAGTASSVISTHLAASDPHTQYQRESEKGSAGGYAPLDVGSLIPVVNLATGTADDTVFLRGDRTWATPPSGGGGGGGSPGGSTGAVQFNSGGVFTGTSNFTYTAASKILAITSGGGYKLPDFTVGTQPSPSTYADCIAECTDHLWSGGTGGPVYSNGTNWLDQDGFIISTTGGIITSGRQAEYRFDEMSGTSLTDYSGNGRNGTLSGTYSWIDWGPRGLLFAGGGAGGWADISQPGFNWFGVNGITVEVVYAGVSNQNFCRWFECGAGLENAAFAFAQSNGGSGQPVVGPGFSLSPSSGYDANLTSATSVNNYRWQYWACTFGGGFTKIFHNLNQTASTTYTGSIVDTTRGLAYIGRSFGEIYGDGRLNGVMALLRVYNRVLTSAERRDNFRATQRLLSQSNIYLL